MSVMPLERIARAYRDPFALISLAVAVFPLFGLVFLGWGADEIVILYWIENLVIGLGVFARLAVLGFVPGKREAFFLAPFFAVHYGLFCTVHGVFLFGMFEGDFSALPPFVVLLLAWEAVLFVRLFLMRSAWRNAEPGQLMFEPYGRVVVVHLGIFAAAFAGEALGAPLAGALAIIVLRALWDVFLSLRRFRTV
ncbi:MAG: DUF6498-containing protein [Pseudomonadota bacterium]